jgi:hypothetical protein
MSEMKDPAFRALIPPAEKQVEMYFTREIEPHRVLLDLLMRKED